MYHLPVVKQKLNNDFREGFCNKNIHLYQFCAVVFFASSSFSSSFTSVLSFVSMVYHVYYHCLCFIFTGNQTKVG